jgi:hypothetical protein
LATWREPDGLAKLVDSVLGSQGSLGYERDNIEEENNKLNTNVKQCLRKVADGHFTAAVKVLGSSGVAPYNEDTMRVLEEKHPYRPPPSTPTTMFAEAPLVAAVDTVLKCVQSFPIGTSCGRDGLCAQHLLDAMCGEGSCHTPIFDLRFNLIFSSLHSIHHSQKCKKIYGSVSYSKFFPHF